MAYLTDSQQKAAYRWEDLWKSWNTQQISREDCKTIIWWACRLYNVPPPERFVIARKGKNSIRSGWKTAFDPNDWSITLAPQHMNAAICLHEVAHLIHSALVGGEPHEAHGPEWLALYMYLLSRAGCAPRIALFATAKVYGLKWKQLDRHNPLRIRKTYRAVRAREGIDS